MCKIVVIFFILGGCKPPPAPVTDIPKTVQAIRKQTPALDPRVLTLAINAYNKTQYAGLNHSQILTIVDFTKPSSQKRLWVIQMKTRRVLYSEWVAHGKRSGKNLYAHVFSDRVNSWQSSLGTYITANAPYSGRFGYALRLKGLEPGFNGNALDRAIVIHGAPYVSAQYLKNHGRMGTTEGCFALDDQVIPQVIDTIRGGTVLFAYYPDHQWLKHSTFLNAS